MTLDELTKLLLTARRRHFRDADYNGYFEDELLDAGVRPKLLKQARKNRDIFTIMKTKNGEDMRFYYI